jgi:hypothetical protein
MFQTQAQKRKVKMTPSFGLLVDSFGLCVLCYPLIASLSISIVNKRKLVHVLVVFGRLLSLPPHFKSVVWCEIISLLT